MYEWDDKKNEKNREKHDVGFEVMADFDWETAIIIPDDRHTEPRWFAMGYISDRLYAVAYTERNKKVRVISLRKANIRERKRYENG
jgi:uncharacterized DUF497 family protein